MSDEHDDDVLRRVREAPAPQMDPFTERRLREAVVRGELPTRAATRSRHRGVAALLVAMCALAALLVFVWPRQAGRTPNQVPWLVISPAQGAVYVRQDDNGSVRVSLTSGSARFAVGAHEQGKLSVVVPDGEIEDLGTEFVVEVEQSRTLRIAVMRGSVVFRRDGAADLVLEEGSSYEAEQRAAAEPPGAALQDEAASSKVTSSATPSAAPTSASSKSAKPRASGPASSAAPPGAATSSPGTSDAEDDAYLRVVALRRESRHEEARAAARDYLRRFPNGFRRVEMTRLAE